ncbi:hypothetical protein [Chryseobacterium limigenitum]|uniref:Heat induced stress protein YflT n=1 Tax=Chryseobacterium limigenitum TaxID=1612149 RepID=A0A1K2IX28_9FLAO|nr:hypothetical protein [Chryseobacterium limigenitum]SFZ96315.1 hypothetical protein SAMN05216324_11841 [Chryseobacterium limigenitum]
MSNILAGLFEHHSDYKQLETDLENSGFGNSDYIVYLNDTHHHPQYMTSVCVKDKDQIDNAKSIFSQNSAVKTYLFENINIEQADYNNIKRLIDARNRAEIHNSPDVKIKASSHGIDSEVKF